MAKCHLKHLFTYINQSPLPQQRPPPPIYFFTDLVFCQKSLNPLPLPPPPPPPPPPFTHKKSDFGSFPSRIKNQISVLFQFIKKKKKKNSAPSSPPPHPPFAKKSIFGFLVSLLTLPSSPTHTHTIFFFQGLESLSKFTNCRELTIRVVGFVLKRLLRYFEMLIVPHFTLGTCFTLQEP